MNEKQVEPMETLANFIVRTQYEDIPADIIDTAKKVILDTIAISVAGSYSEGCQKVVEYVKNMGGVEQSSILVHGGKVPAPMAAFANAIMARALDLGEIHPEAAHVAEYVLPSLMAVAEMRGNVTGKEFLTAFIIGYDIASRIGEASFGVSEGLVHRRHPCFGPFGAVASTAKLLDFNASDIWNVMGIYYSVSGSWDMQMYDEGTLMVRAHHSFACEDAVHSVLLGKEGLSGPKEIFSGSAGFFTQFFPWKNNPDILTSELGDKWCIAETCLKPYTSCKFTHSPIDGIISIVNENKIDISDVEKIDCKISKSAEMIIEPKKDKWNPQSMAECQFSLPYTVATAAIKKKVFIDDFNVNEIAREDVRELMKRIDASVDNELPIFTSEVNVTLKNKSTYSKRIDYVKGHYKNPMTWEELIEKCRLCISSSKNAIPKSNIDESIEKLFELEKINDISQIINSICG